MLKSTPEEGTLQWWILDFVLTPGASTADWIKTDAADDKHIKKWTTSSMEKGLDEFSRDLLHDRSRAKAKPLTFAVMARPREKYIVLQYIAIYCNILQNIGIF
jgi:hypothetical protein